MMENLDTNKSDLISTAKDLGGQISKLNSNKPLDEKVARTEEAGSEGKSRYFDEEPDQKKAFNLFETMILRAIL